MTVRELVEAFHRDQVARANKLSTRRYYLDRLAPFVAAYGERDAATLTLVDIQQYLAARAALNNGTPASDTTRHHTAKVVAILQKWAFDLDLIPKLWAKRIPKPPIGMRERLPTQAEIEAILLQKPRRPDFERIVNALRISGARPSELCAARIEDIRSQPGGGRWIELADHKTARKTGRPRRIPIGETFGGILRRAIGQRKSGPIFLRRDGVGWTRATLSGLYRRRRDAAGLPKDLCLYLTRHEAGTRITRAAGVEQAARALGHAPGSRETARYVLFPMAEVAGFQDAGAGGPGSATPR